MSKRIESVRLRIMKGAIGLLMLIFSVSVSMTAAREFTDAKGRKIEAELVAHAGKKVIISSGGKEFTLDVNSFSLDDQAYISQWIKDNPDAVRFAFRYFVDLDKGIKQNAKVDYDERLQTIPMEYSISVTNQGPGPLKDAEIQAMVFVDDKVDTRDNRFRSLASGSAPQRGRTQRLLATAPVDLVGPGGRVDLDLVIPIHYYVDRDYGRIDAAVKDAVLGVWIRVKKGKRVLADRIEAEDDKQMEGVQWKTQGAEKIEAKVEIK